MGVVSLFYCIGGRGFQIWLRWIPSSSLIKPNSGPFVMFTLPYKRRTLCQPLARQPESSLINEAWFHLRRTGLSLPLPLHLPFFLSPLSHPILIAPSAPPPLSIFTYHTTHPTDRGLIKTIESCFNAVMDGGMIRIGEGGRRVTFPQTL